MKKKVYSQAQKRTIRIALKNGLTAKQTTVKVNALKSTIKTGNTVTSQAIVAAFRRCSNEKWS